MASKPQELAIKKPATNCPVHWVAWRGCGFGPADQGSVKLCGAPSSTHSYQNLQATLRAQGPRGLNPGFMKDWPCRPTESLNPPHPSLCLHPPCAHPNWLQGPDHPLQLAIMHIVLPSSLLMNPNVDYLSVATSSSRPPSTGSTRVISPKMDELRWVAHSYNEVSA